MKTIHNEILSLKKIRSKFVPIKNSFQINIKSHRTVSITYSNLLIKYVNNVIFEKAQYIVKIVLIIGLGQVCASWKEQLESYVWRNFFIVGMARRKLV